MSRGQDANNDLPPIVREALAALRSVPEPGPEDWASHRQAFLAQVRDLAVAGAVTPDEKPRRSGWSTVLGSIFTFRTKEATPMSIIARLVVMIALALGGSIGTVQAARESLPGTLLYAVKTQLERLEILLAGGPEQVTEKALAQAQERVEEVARLAEEGRQVPSEVAQQYQRHLEVALQASNQLEEPMRNHAQEQIQQVLRRQLALMAEVEARVQSRTGESDGEAVEAIMRAMRQMQERLGELQLPPHDTVPPMQGTSPVEMGHGHQGSDMATETPMGMPTSQTETHEDTGSMDHCGDCHDTAPMPECTPANQPGSDQDEGAMDDHQDVATPTSVPTTESNPADPGGADQQDQGRMQQDPTPTPIPADPGGGDMGGGHDDGPRDPGGGH